MRNNKILKYLGMLPRVSLFSNTRINTFVNTIKGKESFANEEEENKEYCKNKGIIIAIRILISVMILAVSFLLFYPNNLAALGVCAIGGLLIPDITLIIMLVLIAIQNVENSMSNNKVDPSSNKYYSENFFLSNTPNSK